MDRSRFSPACGIWPDNMPPDLLPTVRTFLANQRAAGQPWERAEGALADMLRYLGAVADQRAGDRPDPTFNAFVRELARIVAEDDRPPLRLVTE